MNPASVKSSRTCFKAYPFTMFPEVWLVQHYQAVSLFRQIILDPEVFPLFDFLYPNMDNNLSISSNMKSLGCLLNRSINFSFVPMPNAFCKRLYQNYHSNVAVGGVSKCDFAMSRDVACRVSMFATIYKTLNINSLFNQIVETQNFASLLPH